DDPKWKTLGLIVQFLIGILFATGGESSGIKLAGGLTREEVVGGLANYLTDLLGLGDALAKFSPKQKLCNGDPFFVFPTSIQPITRTKNRVQILHVSGGLVAPPVAETENGSPGEQASGDYDDRPESFVGGAAPGGAATIGEWKWDTNRPFGAALSHTQAAAAG